MGCLAHKFASLVSSESNAAVGHVKDKCSSEDLFAFLQWAQGLGDVVGLQVC